MTGLSDKLRSATRALSRAVDGLDFAEPVTHVYNPLDYAFAPYSDYLRRYASAPKRVVYLGMNPGPYGMAQTGIPFGEVTAVRDWLGIEGKVQAPAHVHPKRPIQGFACQRSEVSGARLWGAISAHYGEPQRFFEHSLVLNYCPLVFMEESGRNRTPDKLPAGERKLLYEACDQHLRRVIELLEPRWVIGVGEFAAGRARDALAGLDVTIGRVLHPSPASPAANRDWAGTAARELRELGVCRGEKS